MCVNKTDKTACNVCFDALTEWRVKPNDVALSVPALLLSFLWLCGMYSRLWLRLLCPSAF